LSEVTSWTDPKFLIVMGLFILLMGIAFWDGYNKYKKKKDKDVY